MLIRIFKQLIHGRLFMTFGIEHISVGPQYTQPEFEAQLSHNLRSGNAFPALVFERDLFYRNDLNKWFIYDGTNWIDLTIGSWIDQDVSIGASPTWVGATFSGLTASRLLATDGAQALASVAALSAWIAGTANRVTVADDGDGTITLSGPQDIHTGASPQFARLFLDDLNTYLDRDGGLNMTFTDAVTGLKTLAELAASGAPANASYVTINVEAGLTNETLISALGVNNLGGTNWSLVGATGVLTIAGLVATANLDIGAFTITGTQFISDIAIGTPPLVVTSTTVIPNLNVDQTDGLDLPNTVANLLTDHNKVLHDALGLSHDSLSDVSTSDHHVLYTNLEAIAAVEGEATLILSGIVTFINSGIHILDTGADHDLILAVGENLGADRTLTFILGDADRILTLSGNPTLGDWFDQSVKAGAAVTFASVDTGQGANELYDMDQNVLEASNVIFATVTVDNSGIHILDLGGDHDLILAVGTDLGADRTLTFTTGDADRTITLSGNPTLDDWFDQAVKQASSPLFASPTVTDLHIIDATVAFDLILASDSTPNFGADRTLTLDLANANRSLILQGNLTVESASLLNQDLTTDANVVFGTITVNNSGIHILDTGGDHDLILASGEDLGADRILTFTLGDAARIITLSGNPTLADWFDQAVKQASNVIFATVTVNNSGIHILDTGGDHDLILAMGTDVSQDRTLTFTTGDANRIITLSGDPTLADWFDQAVKAASSPTFASPDFTGTLTVDAIDEHTLNAGVTIDTLLIKDNAIGSVDAEIDKIFLDDVGEIYWGLGQDTVLYRQGVAELKTDGKFIVLGDIEGADQLLLTVQGAGGGIVIGGDTQIYRSNTTEIAIKNFLLIDNSGSDAHVSAPRIRLDNTGVGAVDHRAYLYFKGKDAVGGDHESYLMYVALATGSNLYVRGEILGIIPWTDGGAGTCDLGDDGMFFGDINYKTLDDRGCPSWIGGAETLNVIMDMRPHPTKKSVHKKLVKKGNPKDVYEEIPSFDPESLPEWLRNIPTPERIREVQDKHDEEWEAWENLPLEEQDKHLEPVLNLPVEGLRFDLLVYNMVTAMQEQQRQIEDLRQEIETFK